MDGRAATLRECVRRALAEDLGTDSLDLAADVTTRLAGTAHLPGRARLIAKAPGILAGPDCPRQAFLEVAPGCKVERLREDSDRLSKGDLVLHVAGDMRALLVAERTALNFVQRLSGIATATRALVDAVAGTGARILDTRKTTPGLRLLEKAAVVAGGGCNHRIGLFDQVLLKENHFAFARPASYEETVRRCGAGPAAPVAAEARDVAEALAAVRGGAAVVLLDNFVPGDALRAAVAAVRSAATALGRPVEIEASGGVDLRTVRSFAECGVDRISVGAITHSAPVVDLSMLVGGVA